MVFRAERGDFPIAWASHLALTDESGGRFRVRPAGRGGVRVDHSLPGEGFALAVRGDILPGAVNAAASPWVMAGASGVDHISAQGQAGGQGGPVGFGLDLGLDAGGRQAVLHDRDGYVDFGPAGGSYYYSRSRMAASGTLTIGGEVVPVSGEAWFDHQWGDFIAVGGGGWDWFAVDLDDGTDLMLSLVRAADGSYPLVYGTLVRPDGSIEHLPDDAFSSTSRGTGRRRRPARPTRPAGTSRCRARAWSSTCARRSRPRSWTRAGTTGVVYWEGSQSVTATRQGVPVGGEAYVELTGYGPDPSSGR